MATYEDVGYWAALICANTWAANIHDGFSALMAGAWFIAAMVFLFMRRGDA